MLGVILKGLGTRQGNHLPAWGSQLGMERKTMWYLISLKNGAFLTQKGMEADNPHEHHGCGNFWKIIHKIRHAFGLWHEQSRPDCDIYAAINLPKYTKGWGELVHNHEVVPSINSRGSAYDYGSTMHYSDPSFFRDNSYCEGCRSLRVISDMHTPSKDGLCTIRHWENGLSLELYDISSRLIVFILFPRSYYDVLSGTLAIHSQYGKINQTQTTYSTVQYGVMLSTVETWRQKPPGTLIGLAWTRFSVRVCNSDFNTEWVHMYMEPDLTWSLLL